MATTLPTVPSEALPTTETSSPYNGSTTKPSRSPWSSTKRYLQSEIAIQHADIPIVACCFVSGLCDSSAYNAWSCFVSMQTGLFPLNFSMVWANCQVILSSWRLAYQANQHRSHLAGSSPSYRSPLSFSAASSSRLHA